MNVADFDFELPPELIAQEPAADRGGARLLHVERATGAISHSAVSALPGLLRPGDLIVVNNTRVFPARLLGTRVPSGGSVECVLLAPVSATVSGSVAGSVAETVAGSQMWEALVHPGQKLKVGARMVFSGRLHAEVVEHRPFGRRLVRLWTEDGSPIDDLVDTIGHIPLPPYIKRDDVAADRERYQTVFAASRGSVAAPTAGLHFTPALLSALTARGVERAEITLHVGYGTFQPVRVDTVEEHTLEPERYDIPPQTAEAINRALDEHRRVIAVGTTTTRTLEWAAQQGGGRISPGRGATSLFIYPGFSFQVLGGLLTNFHLPKSSLLMLVSAFAGREPALAAYRDAVANRYRFYSYGEAMLIL
ncbi:MAG TPA: tRNA preQ1(34) S-adenosylmethionine ribosyltransferase-isomerase QueA [Vicinamibacterales bacterium]|nr:tRNA preQ1(34) S-adenosylmethionine ribosyltransferase-isomerase QueA [Vicinamibacterales bacterium]